MYWWNVLVVLIVVMYVLVLLNTFQAFWTDKLQKRVYRTVGPGLAAFLEPLAHRRNAASFSIGITLVDVHLTCLVAIPY